MDINKIGIPSLEKMEEKLSDICNPSWIPKDGLVEGIGIMTLLKIIQKMIDNIFNF